LVFCTAEDATLGLIVTGPDVKCNEFAIAAEKELRSIPEQQKLNYLLRMET
jgi:hypothetical protein